MVWDDKAEAEAEMRGWLRDRGIPFSEIDVTEDQFGMLISVRLDPRPEEITIDIVQVIERERS